MTKNTLLALLLTVPGLALANGYEVITVNPRDLALVQSTVASQSEAPAAFFNPASLSRVEGLSLAGAGSMLNITTKWTAPAGNADVSGSARTKFHPATPISFSAAWGTKLAGRGLGVGLSLGNPGGGNVFYDDDWAGRGRIISVEQRVFGLYLSGGYELVPDWLRVGASGIYYNTSEYLKQGIQPVPGATARLSTRGGGYSFGLSAEATPVPGVPLTLGVDYKHQSIYTLKGDATFDVPPALAGGLVQDQDVRHRIAFPNLLAVGAAYRFTDDLEGMLQWSYSRWHVYQDDTFIGSKGAQIVVPRKYKDGNILRGGVEWKARPGLKLRAGLMRDWSGLNTAAYSPTLPDANIWAGAVGAGWAFVPNATVEGAFFYGSRDKVTSTNNKSATNLTGTFPGSFKTDVWILTVGATFKLPGLGQ